MRSILKCSFLSLILCHCVYGIELINKAENSRQHQTQTRTSLHFYIARDCAEIKTIFPQAVSAVYTVFPIPGVEAEVYCDMDYEGGGWTVIQRRGEPLIGNEKRQDFFLDWADYERGFGSAEQDYWIGLANIAALSRLQDSEILFELTDWTNDVKVANYKTFKVADSAEEYKLTVGGYIGNAGDSFLGHSGMKFSTRDNDQDTWPKNCAETFKGGWWYSSCHSSNLNGLYAPEGSNGTTVDFAVGIVWYSWKEHYYSLKKVSIKIRSKVYTSKQ